MKDYSHSDKKGSGDEELLGFALISKFPSKNMFTFHGFIDSSASYFWSWLFKTNKTHVHKLL